MVAHLAYHTVYRAASDEFRYAQTLLDSDPPFPEHLFPIAIISTSLLIARKPLQYVKERCFSGWRIRTAALTIRSFLLSADAKDR